MQFDPAEHPHRRFNPLTGEWVLVSPHRTKRPWQGRQEDAPNARRPHYDSKCYLCPGNERVGGEQNPAYESTFVFDNDFAALLPEAPDAPQAASGSFFRTEAVRGICRVICFSPRHDQTLADMTPEAVRRVIELWAGQTAELGQKWRWIQIFENKGAVMGCSNPHPHGQIWAGSSLPNEPAKEHASQREWLEKNGEPMLVQYARTEAESGERTIIENDHWIAVVPYWAVWPYETLLLPKARHIARLPELDSVERDALAELMPRLLSKFDHLFKVSFPYSMGWHGAPFDNEGGEAWWQVHAHFYPPLLRSATVRKFLVGYEMLAEVQRDLTAEQAAARLRKLPETPLAAEIQ